MKNVIVGDDLSPLVARTAETLAREVQSLIMQALQGVVITSAPERPTRAAKPAATKPAVNKAGGNKAAVKKPSGTKTSTARPATAPRAPTAKAPAAPRAALAPRSPERSAQYRAKVLEVVSAGNGVSSGEIRRSTGFTMLIVRYALGVLRREGKVQMAGDKGLARYATTAEVAERAHRRALAS